MLTKSVDLNPDQIKLLKNTTQLARLADLINMYMKQYYDLDKASMPKKRRENIEYIGRVSVPYMRNVDQLLNQLRDQIKE